MPLLERWNPSHEMERIRRQFDDLLEQFGLERSVLPSEWVSPALRPALESYVEGDRFVVRLDLPGVDPNDVDISVAGGILTVKGSRKEKPETSGAHLFRQETRYGAFERSITLPEGIKGDELKASYRDGVLELTAPMPKEQVPRKVKVQIEAAEPKKAVEPKAA
jgi:HSP20 family protein